MALNRKEPRLDQAAKASLYFMVPQAATVFASFGVHPIVGGSGF